MYFDVDEVYFNRNGLRAQVKNSPMKVSVPGRILVLLRTSSPVRLYGDTCDTNEKIDMLEQEMFERLEPQSQRILQGNTDNDEKYKFTVSYAINLTEDNWADAIAEAQENDKLCRCSDTFALLPTSYEPKVNLLNTTSAEITEKELLVDKSLERIGLLGQGLLGVLHGLCGSKRVDHIYVTI